MTFHIISWSDLGNLNHISLGSYLVKPENNNEDLEILDNIEKESLRVVKGRSKPCGKALKLYKIHGFFHIHWGLTFELLIINVRVHVSNIPDWLLYQANSVK